MHNASHPKIKETADMVEEGSLRDCFQLTKYFCKHYGTNVCLGSAGIQCLDPHLRYPALCGEHSQIWPPAKIPGCPAQTEPEEHNEAAEASGLPVWLIWCATLIGLLSVLLIIGPLIAMPSH